MIIMKNSKVARNVWIFTGFCFLGSFILNLTNYRAYILPILYGVACVFSFSNVYIYHKEYKKSKK
jgi:hypothetical protein